MNPATFATWVQDVGFPMAALIATGYALSRVYTDQRREGIAHRAEAMKALGENTALILSASHTGETSVTLSLDTSTDLAAIVRAAIR